jgi:PhzF family phenazine biosynthesis protein
MRIKTITESGMQVEVHIVNAFIDGDSGGNPAGVVVNANGLSAAQKLQITQAVGLSETAFVSESQSATVKLEFFTPTGQIAHCGHATVATFSLLRELGIVAEGVHAKQTMDGNRRIIVEADMVFMEQAAPVYAPVARGTPACGSVLRSLGIGEEQLLPELSPCIANTGNPFLLIPLRDAAAVKALDPDQSLVAAVSEALDVVGYYAFSASTTQPGRAAGARMFAPRVGIAEEAATGTAAGPLACYLHDVMGRREDSVLVEQGWLMPAPSPSVIQVDLVIEGGRVCGLMAGGRAKSATIMNVDVAP